MLIAANTLKSKNYETILVVPPKSDAELFTPDDYDNLYDSVTGFSLMTYDFSSVHRPGIKNRLIFKCNDTLNCNRSKCAVAVG